MKTKHIEKDDRILRMNEVIHKTGFSRSTICRLRKRGEFPKSIPLGGQSIGFLLSEVNVWLESLIAAREGCPNE